MSEEKVCCICGNEVINSSICIEVGEETRLVCSTCIGEGLIRLSQDESLNEVVIRSAKEAADVVKRLMEEEELKGDNMNLTKKQEDMAKMFKYHPPKTEERIKAHERINNGCLNLALLMSHLIKDEKILEMAIFALQQARMLANQGITIDELNAK